MIGRRIVSWLTTSPVVELVPLYALSGLISGLAFAHRAGRPMAVTAALFTAASAGLGLGLGLLLRALFAGIGTDLRSNPEGRPFPIRRAFRLAPLGAITVWLCTVPVTADQARATPWAVMLVGSAVWAVFGLLGGTLLRVAFGVPVVLLVVQALRDGHATTTWLMPGALAGAVVGALIPEAVWERVCAGVREWLARWRWPSLWRELPRSIWLYIVGAVVIGTFYTSTANGGAGQDDFLESLGLAPVTVADSSPVVVLKCATVVPIYLVIGFVAGFMFGQITVEALKAGSRALVGLGDRSNLRFLVHPANLLVVPGFALGCWLCARNGESPWVFLFAGPFMGGLGALLWIYLRAAVRQLYHHPRKVGVSVPGCGLAVLALIYSQDHRRGAFDLRVEVFLPLAIGAAIGLVAAEFVWGALALAAEGVREAVKLARHVNIERARGIPWTLFGYFRELVQQISNLRQRVAPDEEHGVRREDFDRLGVPPDSTLLEIKQAYRALARYWHPDHWPEADRQAATEKMIQINEAYDRILTAPTRSGKRHPGLAGPMRPWAWWFRWRGTINKAAGVAAVLAAVVVLARFGWKLPDRVPCDVRFVTIHDGPARGRVEAYVAPARWDTPQLANITAVCENRTLKQMQRLVLPRLDHGDYWVIGLLDGWSWERDETLTLSVEGYKPGHWICPGPERCLGPGQF